MNIISNERRDADLATQIVSRTYEVYQYDLNIQNYEAILAALPEGEWPEEILSFRGMNDHEAAFACPAELIDTLSQYQLRDRISNLIKSERVERAKVAALLSVTDSMLVGPGRDAALEAAIARRETALSA